MIVSRRTIPKDGDLKAVKKFAWVPHWIGEVRIWLQRYEKHYKFRVRKRTTTLWPTAIVYEGIWGDWDYINETFGD